MKWISTGVQSLVVGSLLTINCQGSSSCCLHILMINDATYAFDACLQPFSSVVPNKAQHIFKMALDVQFLSVDHAYIIMSGVADVFTLTSLY